MGSFDHQHPVNRSLEASLLKRKEENALRALIQPSQLIDLSSNDYLGLARSEKLRGEIDAFLQNNGTANNGSTGSRLLSGNTAFAEKLEEYIASFHKAEAALIFNSGYDANLGLLSCVPHKGDTIIYDELIHASVHDGLKLNQASSYRFRHNDMAHLEERLKAAAGNIFVVVESVYSMDGDVAPLTEMTRLCREYNANLIVDEAHATGIFGKEGSGKVNELGLEQEVFARVHTFGKALGVHGAAVVGSRLLRDYLVNFARSFIYTTALPLHSLAAVYCAYERMRQSNEEREKLSRLIRLFREGCGKDVTLVESISPVQCVIIEGNSNVKQAATELQQCGFDVRPILSPTVPRGQERLRICLHAFNTESQVTILADILTKICSGLRINQKLNNLATS